MGTITAEMKKIVYLPHVIKALSLRKIFELVHSADLQKQIQSVGVLPDFCCTLPFPDFDLSRVKVKR